MLNCAQISFIYLFIYAPPYLPVTPTFINPPSLSQPHGNFSNICLLSFAEVGFLFCSGGVEGESKGGGISKCVCRGTDGAGIKT